LAIGFDPTPVGALVREHESECGDDQDRADRREDDGNEDTGGHCGSLNSIVSIYRDGLCCDTAELDTNEWGAKGERSQ
jgi:hypothetical protein